MSGNTLFTHLDSKKMDITDNNSDTEPTFPKKISELRFHETTEFLHHHLLFWIDYLHSRVSHNVRKRSVTLQSQYHPDHNRRSGLR